MCVSAIILLVKRIEKIIKEVKLDKLVGSWTNGYHTNVGEQGAKLSGGQIQRIGIARALYRNANVIIFDEATSSLDPITEKEVMEAINGLGKEITVLIIAHRFSTLANCDKIFQLRDKKIFKELEYKDLVLYEKKDISKG